MIVIKMTLKSQYPKICKNHPKKFARAWYFLSAKMVAYALDSGFAVPTPLYNGGSGGSSNMRGGSSHMKPLG